MTIRVVVDSTADLPAQVSSELGIEVIPMLIHLGPKSFKDQLEITREQFYERLSAPGVLAQTAAPGPGQFTAAYDRVVDEGASGILSLHLASSLSATYSVGASMQSAYTRAKVTAVDSGQLSLGLGFLAEAAARALKDGATMEAVQQLMEDQLARTFVLAALDTMEYLRRSGRVNSLVAGLGSALRIKPMLKLHGGVATSERVRTSSRADQRLLDLLHELAPLERAAVVHANAPERASGALERAKELLPQEGLIVANITPAIGAHVGPGTVGYVVVAKDIERARAARRLFQ